MHPRQWWHSEPGILNQGLCKTALSFSPSPLSHSSISNQVNKLVSGDWSPESKNVMNDEEATCSSWETRGPQLSCLFYCRRTVTHKKYFSNSCLKYFDFLFKIRSDNLIRFGGCFSPLVTTKAKFILSPPPLHKYPQHAPSSKWHAILVCILRIVTTVLFILSHS